jgi:hypothetical protein
MPNGRSACKQNITQRQARASRGAMRNGAARVKKWNSVNGATRPDPRLARFADG